MLTRSILSIFSLAVLFTLSGCDNKPSAPQAATESSISVEHNQGTTTVPLEPKKVVVFNIETLDTMDALGINIAAVPQTSAHLPKFLSKYETANYNNAGSLFEPNYEALSNMQPDLIIAGGRTNDAYDKLSEIAPTISLEVDSKDWLNSLMSRTNQLGEIFNKQSLAKQLIDNFTQKISKVKSKAKDQGTAMVIMINGGKMLAYGAGSRFSFIYDQLGFTPAAEFASTGKHGNVINAEFLLSVNPDWLFVLDRDSAIGNSEAQSAQQVLDNALMHKTQVWQNNKIVYLDSSAMYIAGGLQTYDKLLDQIDQLLK